MRLYFQGNIGAVRQIFLFDSSRFLSLLITTFQFVQQQIARQLHGELNALQHSQPSHGQTVIAGSFGQEPELVGVEQLQTLA